MQEREDIQINKEYGQVALLEKDEFKKQFNVNEEIGLTKDKVLENTKKYGVNEIKGSKPKKWYHYFFESLFSV